MFRYGDRVIVNDKHPAIFREYAEGSNNTVCRLVVEGVTKMIIAPVAWVTRAPQDASFEPILSVWVDDDGKKYVKIADNTWVRMVSATWYSGLTALTDADMTHMKAYPVKQNTHE